MNSHSRQTDSDNSLFTTELLAPLRFSSSPGLSQKEEDTDYHGSCKPVGFLLNTMSISLVGLNVLLGKGATVILSRRTCLDKATTVALAVLVDSSIAPPAQLARTRLQLTFDIIHLLLSMHVNALGDR